MGKLPQEEANAAMSFFPDCAGKRCRAFRSFGAFTFRNLAFGVLSAASLAWRPAVSGLYRPQLGGGILREGGRTGDAHLSVLFLRSER